MEKAGDYQRGYLAGYRDGLAAAQQGSMQLPAVLQQPIEVLGLPVRPLNCLRAYDCRLVEDVAGLPAETIRRMRNLGKQSADEITQALHRFEIFGTAWDAFLL